MFVLNLIETASAPWGKLYNDSTTLQTTMTFLHFGALLFAGGFAVASDRWVLRAARARDQNQDVVLTELAQIHTPVVAGIGLLVVTGLAMALADAHTLLTSPVFWIKMGCFLLLLLNGLLLRAAESHLRANTDPDHSARWWKILRGSAVRSMSLWLITVLLGTMLTSAS